MVSANPYGPIINLGNILSCQPQPVQHTATPDKCKPQAFDTSARNSVVLELLDERNTITRVMMHFAHFEKEAERIDEKHYKIKIKYNQFDETELLIRILSFGPFVKVIEPQSFVDKIKERLSLQKELLR